jgi:hypothetical protein
MRHCCCKQGVRSAQLPPSTYCVRHPKQRVKYRPGDSDATTRKSRMQYPESTRYHVLASFVCAQTLAAGIEGRVFKGHLYSGTVDDCDIAWFRW